MESPARKKLPTTNLEVFKYKAKNHEADFTRLALYFNKLWQWSFPQKEKHQQIRLTRLYKTVQRRHRPLVKMAANIWFEQATRGDSLTKKCSMWKRREHPKLNAQVLRAFREAQSNNMELVNEMWEMMSQKNEVEIVIKTTVRFPTIEAAEKFREDLNKFMSEYKLEEDQ